MMKLKLYTNHFLNGVHDELKIVHHDRARMPKIVRSQDFAPA